MRALELAEVPAPPTGVMATASFSATRHCCRRVLRWQSHGELTAVGVKAFRIVGRRSRPLPRRAGRDRGRGEPPQPPVPRRRGKSDTVDTEAAARAVLNGQATVTPKAGTGPVGTEVVERVRAGFQLVGAQRDVTTVRSDACITTRRCRSCGLVALLRAGPRIPVLTGSGQG